MNHVPITRRRFSDRSRSPSGDCTTRGGLAAKDSASHHDATYEKGASPIQAGAAKPNFLGGRVKANVAGLGNTYSVELWFRNDLPVHSRPVTAYVFSRAVDGREGAFGDNLGIGGTHSNRGRLIVFNGNRRNELIAGQTRIPTGGWSHVVMVRQEQKVTVYLNGDPKPEIAADLPVDYPNDCAEMLLGGRADNFANLQGTLEEVALFDRALEPHEVKSHFDAAGAKLVSRYSPGDDAGGTEADPIAKPTPTEVDKALDTIHVPDGFEVQLVAAEPLVRDPVAIDWGPDGKLWVVEMADYPLGVDGKGMPGGRVRFLEDTDNDGNYDTSTLFAEGLSFPTGVLAWGSGVPGHGSTRDCVSGRQHRRWKVRCSPRALFGFSGRQSTTACKRLRWGLDNWVYCASGSHHGGYGKKQPDHFATDWREASDR